jgi:hypothetical protein
MSLRRVRRVCEERLPGVPITYVVADVCRTNLLVEIEGIAYSHSQTPVHVRRCSARQGEPLTPAACRHLCPDGCPERNDCPNAVLH